MKTSFHTHFISFLLIGSFFFTPLLTFAAELEVAGWIPYWKSAEGTKDAKARLNTLDLIYPFAYTIKEDGTLHDMADLKSSVWTRLFSAARKKGVLVVPSIMSSNGAAIHALLSDPEKRENHINNIVSMVKKGKYDGVDIDYEAKRASTNPYFSLFLEELKEELNGKLLVCTIEARTPPSSLYTTVPATIEYANDYVAIGTHCDIVQIMTYDQGRADIKLNAAKTGSPYAPVADIDWVQKVVELAVQSIPRDKIMLGVPTYGYEYEVTVAPNWFKTYSRIGSLSKQYFDEKSKTYKITPSRDKAGESSYTYFPATNPYAILNSLSIPGTSADKALLFANVTGQSVTVNYAVLSDAQAIKAKVDLAKKYKLRGIAIFKIDGGEDPNIWKLF